MKKKLMKYLGVKNNVDWYPHPGELILLQSILLSMDKSGRAPLSKVDKYFCGFYRRLNWLNGEVNISKLELSFIKSESYRAIAQAGFVSLEKDSASFVLAKKLVKKLSNHDVKQLKKLIANKLNGALVVAQVDIVRQIDVLQGVVESWEQEQGRLVVELDIARAQQLRAKLQKAQRWKALVADFRLEVSRALQEWSDAEHIPNIVSPTIQGGQSLEVVSVTVVGEHLAVDSWGAVLLKVCELMLLNRPYQIASFDRVEQLNSPRRVFSYIQSELGNRPQKLANGLYVETDNSGADTVALCRMIMELCGYSADELVIECR